MCLLPTLLLCVVLTTCSALGAWDQLLAIISAESWFDVAWQKRIKLSFNNSDQNEDLIDFPVLVVLNSSKIDYSNFKVDGSDIRFIDAGDATTALPYEIESWISGGTSYIWVRTPRINGASGSDHIWLYFGNPGATSGENPSAVWNDRYVGVWHLNAAYTDSSQYGNHGTTSNGPGNVTGPIADAGSFDGANSYVEIADSFSLDITGSLTLEAWIKKENIAGDRIIVSKYNKGFSARSYDLGFDRGGHFGQSYVTVSSDGVLNNGGILESTSAIANDEWHHVTGVYDNSNLKLYMFLDGILDSEKTSNQPSILLSDETVLIGAMWDGVVMNVNDFWHGDIDEVRISDTPRSADWLAAQYLAMTDSFITFSSVDSYE